MRGYPVKTPEGVAEAIRMRAAGATYKAIGQHFGIKVTTAHTWCSDPDGTLSKQRKDSYRGTCTQCGGPTTGCDGPTRTPTLCADCRHWTPEAVVGALQDWFEEHDHPPRCVDAIHSAGRLPVEATVRRLFGSWNDGLEAAGVPVLQDKRPATHAAIVAALRAGEPTADIAARYGVGEAAIHMRLRYRGESITSVRRQAA